MWNDPTMFAIETSRVKVSIHRVPESVLNRSVLNRQWSGLAFRRLGDATASACRQANGRRVLVERPNGTFRALRCRAGK